MYNDSIEADDAVLLWKLDVRWGHDPVKGLSLSA